MKLTETEKTAVKIAIDAIGNIHCPMVFPCGECPFFKNATVICGLNDAMDMLQTALDENEKSE